MNLVILTGGFDPVHSGHISMFKEAACIGHILVCLNSDKWLERKKGKAFMSFSDRSAVVGNMYNVISVMGFNDTDGTAIDAIRKAHKKYSGLYNEIYFANGGDRNRTTTPLKEQDICKRLGIKVIWGVGGTDKKQSSSDILKLWSKGK